MSGERPPIEFRVLSGADVKALLPMDACIALMRTTMIAVSEGRAQIPPRTVMPAAPGGFLGNMPGALEGAGFGVKLLSLYPENPKAGFSSHLGIVLLFEPEHGLPIAMMDAAEITAIRTAAVSGLATQLLACEDAGDLAILGSGEQARSHLAAMLVVRKIRRVRVWSRTPKNVADFARTQGAVHGIDIEVAESAEAAVTGADLICTVTASRDPVLKGAWIAPGAHINAAGASRAESVEVDQDAVVRSRYFVDFRPSMNLEAGEYLRALAAGAIGEDHVLAEIGEVASGARPGRASPDEITLFKSLGVAAEDLAAGRFILEAAKAKGVGQVVTL